MRRFDVKGVGLSNDFVAFEFQGDLGVQLYDGPGRAMKAYLRPIAAHALADWIVKNIPKG